MRTGFLIALCVLAGASPIALAEGEGTVYRGKGVKAWALELRTLPRPLPIISRHHAPHPTEILQNGRERALPMIRALLLEVEASVRADLAYAVLGRMRPLARDLYADEATNGAVRELLKLLDDEYPEVRSAAAGGIGNIVCWAGPMFVRPKSDTMAADVPNSVVFTEPPRFGPLLRQAERRLRQLESDPDQSVRRTAANVLDRYFDLKKEPPPPESPEDAVARLLEEIQGRAQSAAKRAAALLSRYPDHAERIVPALIEATETRAFLRAAAVRSLGILGPVAKAALPRLRHLMRKGFAPERPIAALAVWRISGDTAEPIACMKNALSGERDTGRRAALDGLRQMGELAAPTVDDIEQRLGANWSSTRQAALVALRRCCSDRDRIVAAHVRALDDPDRYVRVTAARGLGILGSPPSEALGGLVRMLDDSLIVALVQACYVLGLMGEDAFDAAVPIAAHLDCPTQSIRREAAHALTLIGADGLEALEAGTTHKLAWVRGEVAGELGALAKTRARSRRFLTRLLEDPSLYVRIEAALALSRAGDRSPLLLEVVLDAADTNDRFDAEWAVQALLDLGPDWVRSWLLLLGEAPGKRLESTLEVVRSIPESRREYLQQNLQELQTDGNAKVSKSAARACRHLDRSK